MSTMSAQRFTRAIPTILTLVVLATVGWWGHHTGWKATSRAALTAAAIEHEDWCSEHNVPDSTCLLCKKPLAKAQAAKEPAAYRAKNEEVRFSQLASEAAVTRAGITTTKVEATDVEPIIDAPAETIYDPTFVARLGTRLPGTVNAVLVHLGEQVATNQVIAVIESAEVGRAKSDLMRALGEQATAAATAVRMSASAEAGYRTAVEVQEAEARLRAARVSVFDAEQSVLNLGLPASAQALGALDPIQLTLRLRTLGLPDVMVATARSANLLPVVAPRAGVVTELHVVSGESIEGGAPIAVVADTSSVVLSLQLSSDVAARAAVGQRVHFRTADGQEVDGLVTTVSPAADESTRRIPVLVACDNRTAKLRVHQVGTASIVLGAAVKAVVLPIEAVQYDGGTAYVFVRRSPTIFRGLPVPVIATTPTGIAVGRLLPGDEVAITGTAMLKGNLFQDKFGADDD